MNPNPTYSHRCLSHQGLIVWRKARELVRLVHSQPIGHAELRDQAQRAAVQCALGIAEGAAHDGAQKKRFYRLARGSVVETVAAYELASDIGETVPLAQVAALGGEVAAMLTSLVR